MEETMVSTLQGSHKNLLHAQSPSVTKDMEPDVFHELSPSVTVLGKTEGALMEVFDKVGSGHAEAGSESSEIASQREQFDVLQVTPEMADQLPEILRSVEAFSTVVLSAGDYRVKEPLVLSAEGIYLCSDTSLTPEGTHGAKLIGDLSGPHVAPMLQITSRTCTVSNIAFEWEHESDNKEFLGCCIAAEGRSAPKLEFLHITCPNGRAIEVREKSKPTIQDCLIKNCVIGIHACGKSDATAMRNRVDKCVASCVRMTERASGMFSGNTFEKGGDACVWAGGKTKGVFRDNLLRNAKGCGVMLGENCQVTVENCEITGEHINGIQVGDEADPVIKNNTITGSQGSGIVLYDKGRGLFVGNHVRASKLAGIGIRDNADPVFVGNTVTDGSGSGFVLLGECQGIYENNQIIANTCAGVGMKGTTTGLFDGNIIKANHGYGVWVQDESCGTFQNNEIEGNHSAGFAVSHNANPQVFSNHITGGKHVGILVQNNGHGTFKQNTISGNKATNMLLVGESCAAFTENVICDSHGGGVLFRGTSRCQLVRNRIIGNSRADVAVLDQSHPRLFANLLQNGQGRGLVITEKAGGEYQSNMIRGHALAGVYVGGQADPTPFSNIISSSTASGLVIEDMARGTFTGNVLLDNESAAVAVQGNSCPTVEANLVRHNGKGGMWLGEKASGIFKNNFVEETNFAWKLGQEITATFQAPPTPKDKNEISTKIEAAMEAAVGTLLNIEYLGMKNPGESSALTTVGIKKLQETQKTAKTQQPEPLKAPVSQTKHRVVESMEDVVG